MAARCGIPARCRAGLHAYVADCKTEADLDVIAQLAFSHCDEVLPVGASGLGAALARRLALAVPSKVLSPVANVGRRAQRPILFVIGSRTATSAEQMVQLREAGAEELAMPLSASEREIEQFFDRNSHRDTSPAALIVRPESSEDTHQFRASEVALTLGRAAAVLIRRLKINTIVIVGGDTAYETFRALAVREASIAGELMPGTAIGTIHVDGEPMTFVTKAGGFGGTDALAKIMRIMQNV